MTVTTSQDATAEALVERIFNAVLGAMDMWSMYLGDRLGLYRAFADGACTEAELLERCPIQPRYLREWLEQQVVTGLIEVDDPGFAPEERTYWMTDGHLEVLTDETSLLYQAPFVQLVTASGVQLPRLLNAYTNGGGVGWADFGEDMRLGQANMNRPWFLSELGSSWFPAVPSLHRALSAGASVADIGCGEGWSSIGMALAYPHATVEGYDIDAPSIEAAQRHAEDYGVAERVTFRHVDAAGVVAGSFDVVTAFECVHDMPHPVEVLATMRRLVKPDGHVVIMDEKVAEKFGAIGDDVERVMYGYSLFICLPDGLNHAHSAGTGTVMRRSTLENYARQAGFSGVEVLPIENDLWRFYRLS